MRFSKGLGGFAASMALVMSCAHGEQIPVGGDQSGLHVTTRVTAGELLASQITLHFAARFVPNYQDMKVGAYFEPKAGLVIVDVLDNFTREAASAKEVLEKDVVPGIKTIIDRFSAIHGMAVSENSVKLSYQYVERGEATTIVTWEHGTYQLP